jgi:hypothetical protein
MASFQDRVIGAIQIQPATFEEVEHDATATMQAAAVVAMASLARGIAAFRFAGVTGIVTMVILGLIGWVIGSLVLYIVGTRLLPGKNTQADFGQMLRTAGFAQAAGILGVVGIIPFLGFLTSIVVGIWILIALVVAVRQALDYEDTMKAVVVCIVAWVIMFVVTALAGVLGIGGAMMTSTVM